MTQLVDPSAWEILNTSAEKIQETIKEAKQLSKEMEQMVLG
jgi:F0F1-type ATP synthase membrane subunit b/b'